MAAAAGVRALLQLFGQFYYLPLLPAVIVTAMLGGRLAVAAAIVMAIALNVLVTPRYGVTDTMVNALLFVCVAWGIAEVCQRLRDSLRRSEALSGDLAAREAMLGAILSSTPIVTLDVQGRVRRMTQAAGGLLGADPSQAAGARFSDILPSFDPRLLVAASESGRWFPVEPDGAPVGVVASVLPEGPGEERFVLSLTDQSRAHAAREEALDLHGRLSHVWRLNSMGQLAATLAHELNQPLTAATVYIHASQTDIARAGPLGDSAARSLEMAKTQLLRAGNIIRRMRDLVSTGEQTLAIERASSMIDDLAPMFSLITRDTDVPIRLDVHDLDDEVLADRIQVQQAVTNLVRNAVEAVAGRAAPLVAVIGRRVDETAYEISVEDNGSGISADRVDEVTRPSRSDKSGGMGLGLAVTRSIVESHDSRLEIGRSPMGGAAFAFRLSRNLEPEGS